MTDYGNTIKQPKAYTAWKMPETTSYMF